MFRIRNEGVVPDADGSVADVRLRKEPDEEEDEEEDDDKEEDDDEGNDEGYSE
jgi:hypothetical protein